MMSRPHSEAELVSKTVRQLREILTERGPSSLLTLPLIDLHFSRRCSSYTIKCMLPLFYIWSSITHSLTSNFPRTPRTHFSFTSLHLSDNHQISSICIIFYNGVALNVPRSCSNSESTRSDRFDSPPPVRIRGHATLTHCYPVEHILPHLLLIHSFAPSFSPPLAPAPLSLSLPLRRGLLRLHRKIRSCSSNYSN